MIQGMNLSKSYANIMGLNITLCEGMTCVVGESGSSKSTLFSMLSGLLTPDSGAVYFNGKNIYTSDSECEAFRLAHCGYIFQSDCLFGALTALENVATPLRWGFGLKWSESRKRAQAALDDVGMLNYSDKRPCMLSGGQRQRVSIARALAKRPTIIWGDEITSALDSTNALKIFTLIRNITKTSVLVTHDQKLAKLASRVITMQDGKISDDTYDNKKEVLCL